MSITSLSKKKSCGKEVAEVCEEHAYTFCSEFALKVLQKSHFANI